MCWPLPPLCRDFAHLDAVVVLPDKPSIIAREATHNISTHASTPVQCLHHGIVSDVTSSVVLFLNEVEGATLFSITPVAIEAIKNSTSKLAIWVSDRGMVESTKAKANFIAGLAHTIPTEDPGLKFVALGLDNRFRVSSTCPDKRVYDLDLYVPVLNLEPFGQSTRYIKLQISIPGSIFESLDVLAQRTTTRFSLDEQNQSSVC